jgi:hypothetical protein
MAPLMYGVPSPKAEPRTDDRDSPDNFDLDADMD